jgi:hypothetical protein
VDLGCGDFRVGSQIVSEGMQYIGVDLVEPLIRYNSEHYASSSVWFLCLDIVSDNLPAGDLCLLRLVLQHLSNAEIQSVMRKAARYRYVLVTEHHPSPDSVIAYNRDKPHGGDTRVVDNSGVYLDKPPFGVLSLQRLLEVPATAHLRGEGEMLVTFLIQNDEGVNGQ